ncbi:MAG: methyl-accepting chemotaxis protein [bacterium]|nr:methyl-accepting chemotaxis protein [bacterium]
MKTIKVKVIVVVIICALLACGICGAVGIMEASRTASTECGEILSLQTKDFANELNLQFSRISQSVDTMADICMQQLTDFNKFQTSAAYVEEYTESVMSVLLQSAENTPGVLTCYIRYNPDFTDPTSGIFFTRNDTSSPFESVVPTDFSIYDPDDAAHVGWYYIPVNHGEPLWMSPYLNENINVYMISYVVPLFIDGTSVGIIGMDVDFTELQNLVGGMRFFDSGYAYLLQADNAVLYHPDLEVGYAAADDNTYGLGRMTAYLNDPGAADEIHTFSLGGKKYSSSYSVLDNGMKLGSFVRQSEVIALARSTAAKILIGAILALVLTLVIGSLFSIYTTKPLKKVTNAIQTIAGLDFRPNADVEVLLKRGDETGDIARAIRQMRESIQTLIVEIENSSRELRANIHSLEDVTNTVDSLSVENSAISQELAASMHETSTSSDMIAHHVTNVTEIAASIENLSEAGVQNAKEIGKRADVLQKKTESASRRTSQMCEEVSEQSKEAIQQAKAVDKINEMTNAISEISSQTNLLALNASIEAARAGDAGRGFAVVASEIGSLASQTMEMVSNINGIVNEVVDAVGNMSACLTHSTEFLGNTVLADYEEFSRVSEQYVEDAREFDSSMTQIQEAINNLAGSMNEINKTVSEINVTIGEATNGITNIAESSSNMKAGVADSRTQVETSVGNIEKLKDAVGKFVM